MEQNFFAGSADAAVVATKGFGDLLAVLLEKLGAHRHGDFSRPPQRIAASVTEQVLGSDLVVLRHNGNDRVQPRLVLIYISLKQSDDKLQKGQFCRRGSTGRWGGNGSAGH